MSSGMVCSVQNYLQLSQHNSSRSKLNLEELFSPLSAKVPAMKFLHDDVPIEKARELAFKLEVAMTKASWKSS